MSHDPILLMGGTGAIGQATARALRAAQPDVPLLIGSREPEKAQRAAAQLSKAEGVAIDATTDDLGLGERRVSAVAVFYMDHRLAGLRFALNRRVPHLSISSGVFEIAPEIAAYMHAPNAAPMVLGYEWLVGATTVPTLAIAKAFGQIDSIRIGALIDEQDTPGPTVATDFEHLSRLQPAALTRRDGEYIWREGDEAKVKFPALDGVEVRGMGFSSIDVVGLATATGARTVQFDLATGVTSARRRGQPRSTEILIEIEGQTPGRSPLRTRHAVVHPGGAGPLTALGTSMILERLTGLDGQPPTPSGLYFPHQVLEPTAYHARLEREGGAVMTLQPL